jgi:dimethylargininase
VSYGGQTMVGTLRRAMVCAPRAAGWADPERAGRWPDLGYAHAPSAIAAEEAHAAVRRVLFEWGVDLLNLGASPDHSPDAVYTHDASIVTDRGAILLRMGKPTRAAEPAAHADFYRAAGVPILGAIREPGTVEGGDLVWLDAATLLVGRGYRTNAAGIDQLRAILAPSGVEVLPAPLPHFCGPGACLHLMSLLSMLDDGTALADVAWLSVPTVELLQTRGIRLIEIDPAERDTLACNVLAIGGRRLVAMDGNPATQERLRAAGFEVRTFPGDELGVNGGGGPTCLTRPILRGD